MTIMHCTGRGRGGGGDTTVEHGN